MVKDKKSKDMAFDLAIKELERTREKITEQILSLKILKANKLAQLESWKEGHIGITIRTH